MLRAAQVAALTPTVGGLPAVLCAQTRVGVGYQWEHHSAPRDHQDYPVGLQRSGERVVSHSGLGAVAAVDFARTTWENTYRVGTLPPQLMITVRSAQSTYSYTGGLRWTRPLSGRTLWHVQALMGASHRDVVYTYSVKDKRRDAETEPLLEIGSGITRRLSERTHLRAQAGYRRIFGGSKSSLLPEANVVRLVIGADISLSK